MIFVGKLIVSKGVDLLLAAWPLVHAANPDARLLVVGFGEYRSALERLWTALGRGRPRTRCASSPTRGAGSEGGDDAPLPILTAFLADRPGRLRRARAAAAAGSVRFAGRLEHDEVAGLVAAADALVFPSTFPEAFGMVAAEAAAAGALPVSAAHSGAAEVSRELAATLPGRASPAWSPSSSTTGAVDGDRRAPQAWLALPDAASASAAASLRRDQSPGCGAGRGWRAACSRRRGRARRAAAPAPISRLTQLEAPRRRAMNRIAAR